MTPAPHIGTGPAHRIALLLHDNGIGDAIHAMPALSQKVRDGFEVHVYSRAFVRRCYESVGCHWHAMDTPTIGWIDDHTAEYGRIYSLSQWCMIHEAETNGNPTLTRFEQFAALIETGLPDRFRWDVRLLTRGMVQKEGPDAVGYGHYIVLALDATLHQRSYPHRQSLVRALRTEEPGVIELGTLPSQFRCDTFDELVSLIFHADLVVSVDTGSLALALALGTPVVALFGPSDSASIVEQFRRYRPSMEATVMASHTYGGCAAPCNFTEARGWQVDGKCKRIADCMAGIPPEQVLDTIKGML
jgi:hypothetical protein